MRSPQVKMCVGNEGQREPSRRSWCSTSSTRSGHRHAGLDARRDRVHRLARERAAAAHQLELARRLHAPQLVHERRALEQLRTRERPAQLEHRLRPGAGPERDSRRARRGCAPPRRRARARRRPPARRSHPAAASPPRWKSTTIRGSTKSGSRPGARKAPATQPCAYERLPKLGRSRSIPVRYSRSDEGGTKSASIPRFEQRARAARAAPHTLRPRSPRRPEDRTHGAHPHLLPDHRHRPLGGLLHRARLRGAPADADPRGGDQRLHGPARRRRPAGADLQLRRRLLRARHRLRPHRAHGRRHGRDARGARASRGSSRSARRTRCARAAPSSASCATRTATGSNS